MKTLLLFLSTLFAATLNAQIVNIPDPNFKAALLQDGVDINNDGEIQYNEAANIQYLYISNSNISDMVGIEAFVNLTVLNCSHNSIDSLDLSQNTNLTELHCNDNSIDTLDFAQNTGLIELHCYNNQLSFLNVTQCGNLQELHCSNNQLSFIDLTQNTNLVDLVCYENQLLSLDVSYNTNLSYLNCRSNQLTYVDVRNGNNTHFSYFNATDNPNLTCIFVDDATYCQNAVDWYKDSNSTYVETQTQCDDLAGIADFGLQHIKIYPNPFKNSISIKSRVNPTSFEVYTIGGKKLLQTEPTNKQKINLSNLKPGVYFLRIFNDQNQTITKKIIKL